MNLRKALVVSCFTVAAAGVSGGVLAQNYFSVHGDYTMADDFDFRVAPGSIATELDDGWGFGAALGTRLGQQAAASHWRVEGELTFRSNDVDSHSLNGGAPLAGATGKVESTAIMLNALYDLTTGGAFVPYAGGGVGLAMIDAKNFGVSTIPAVLDDDDTVLAYQLIAGAGYRLSPGTELFAEYRWFATESPDVTTSAATGAVDTSIDYQTNNIMVGARFNF